MRESFKGVLHRISNNAITNYISNGKIFERKGLIKAPNSSRVKCATNYGDGT